MSKIYNNWRVFLAEKTFQDFSQGEKDKWIELAYDELMADKAATAAGEDTINKELYDLIDVSYANIGGHVSFKSVADMPSDYPNWEAADVDDDPQADAVIFGKGDKYSGGAADGSPEGKKAMLDKTAEFLNTHGKYGEFSDALAHIMMTRYNIPSVNDEQAVRDILNKDIEWVGANPNGKYPNHTGWYMRMLADGKAHMKIILGHPEQATALQKMEDEILAEIKDYSTGKKYFVSDFQEKVRKRNIKSKKRLIGTGNEGALSGLGAMEEEKKKTHRLDKEYDTSALKKGTKVEMEHEKGISNNKRAHDMAEKTAKDHLDEDPKYYDKLEKIEKKLEEHIVKKGSKFCLKSKKSGKNLGCYPTKAGAKKREKQVQYFKHVNESATLEEGILKWLGLERPSAPEREKEQYLNYSQPDSSKQLYIGAFPSVVQGEMDDALTKFDIIYNMSSDAKDIVSRNSPQVYNKLVADGKLVDEYAIEDLDLDETADAQRIQEENAKLTTAANRVAQDVQAGKKVLVVCSEGRNRSVATSIVALKTLGMDSQEAYQAIKAARAKTMDEIELIKAAKENRRPRRINKPVMQIGDKPHARFAKFAGITPDKIEEMIERFLAKILKGG